MPADIDKIQNIMFGHTILSKESIDIGDDCYPLLRERRTDVRRWLLQHLQRLLVVSGGVHSGDKRRSRETHRNQLSVTVRCPMKTRKRNSDLLSAYFMHESSAIRKSCSLRQLTHVHASDSASGPVSAVLNRVEQHCANTVSKNARNQ